MFPIKLPWAWWTLPIGHGLRDRPGAKYHDQQERPSEGVSKLGLKAPEKAALYLRGCAYLLAHNGSAAVAEFQKLLDHPGLVDLQPIGALDEPIQAAKRYAELNAEQVKAAFAKYIHLDDFVQIVRGPGGRCLLCQEIH
jgi:hypothetical protein